MLNLHKAVGNYCDIPEESGLMQDEELQKRFIAVWVMLEKDFSDDDDVVFELLNEGTAILKNSGATDTPRLDSEVLLMHVLGCDKMSLILNDKMSVSFLDEERFFSLLKRRKESEPISYITGEREFMSLKFFVAEGILIPRPDTEVLTEFVIEKAKKIKNAEILDLCTGSGAIAVSVAKYVKDSKVLAVDFSPKCLHFAEKKC